METEKGDQRIRSTFSRLRDFSGQIVGWLFKPSARLKDPGDIKQAGLTAILTLFCALLLATGALMVKNPIGKVLLPLLSAISLFSYGLSRTRHFRVGGFLLLITWTVTSLGYIYVGQTDYGASQALLLFVPLAFLLGIALVRLRSLLLLVLINIIGAILMPLFDPTISRAIFSTIGVLICLGGLALIIQRNRDTVERERIRALAESNLELKQLQSSLQEVNQDLEIRLQEREDLIRELEGKNAELERFNYTVSHDLKSPLVTIIGYLGHLEEETASVNSERLKHDIQRIRVAVKKMDILLRDLLELSRIGRFINTPVAISFEEVVKEALNITDGQLKAGGIRVSMQPNLPKIQADHHRLVEVLQNLIDNAAKFMGDQPQPQIEIGQEGEEAGKPVLYVKDNGIGIEPRFHEHIFGLFNKLNPAIDGTGVGLALVKRIIEVHGGRIWVVSESGKGAIFYFTIPAPLSISPRVNE